MEAKGQQVANKIIKKSVKIRVLLEKQIKKKMFIYF